MSCSVSGGSLEISTFLSSPVNHDLVCIIPTFLFEKKKILSWCPFTETRDLSPHQLSSCGLIHLPREALTSLGAAPG